MKLLTIKHPRRNQGYALMFTVILVGVSLLVLGATLRLTTGECRVTARHNTYSSCVAAAEAATERVIAQIERDFHYQSLSTDLRTYAALVPDQSGWSTQYQFSDAVGNSDQTGVTSGGSTMATNQPAWTGLNSAYPGLYGIVMPYEITARATALNKLDQVSAAVSQDIQLALIPVFQYAIFYNMDLEINPGPDMTITGKVHSNANLYTAPGAALSYMSDVTSVGKIIRRRHPDDPSQSIGNDPAYKGRHDEKVGSMAMPIGADNSPEAVAAILDRPPLDEGANSPTGRLRFYSNADLVVQRTATGELEVRSGAWKDYALIPKDGVSVSGYTTNTFYSFVNTASFYDYREKMTVEVTQIDVAKLREWVASKEAAGGAGINDLAKFNLNHELNSIYVIDERTPSASRLSGVRVLNGSVLPNHGLTVATPHPLYVQGHFNLNNGDKTPGLGVTAQTKPAALIGDGITVLSEKWTDNYAANTSLSSRAAANTTVNAAFLSGIVTTKIQNGAKFYSGGVENFPRFLENWSGNSLTYNGSMVVMFPSRQAKGVWQSPGNYYNAPTRRWAFDSNFLDHKRLPPLTPMVRKLIRSEWAMK